MIHVGRRRSTIRVFILVVIAVIGSQLCFSEEDSVLKHYSSHFTGLSTEVVIFPFQLITIKSDFRIESVNVVYTWGKREMFSRLPLRLRAGLGFWVDSNFTVLTGAELGFFELLNRYQARMFGLYGVADLVFRTRPSAFGFSGMAGIKTIIPVSNMSCIGITGSYDTTYGLLLRMEYTSGVYLLK